MERKNFFSISITLLETFWLTSKLAKKLSFESHSLLLEFDISRLTDDKNMKNSRRIAFEKPNVHNQSSNLSPL